MSRKSHRLLAATTALLTALTLAVSVPASARGGVNIKLTSLSTSATKVQQFGVLEMSDAVKRAGALPGGVIVGFYLSKDVKKGASDVPLIGLHRLPAGSGTDSYHPRLGVPGLTPTGSYYVIACADPYGSLAETSESDNCRATSSTVTVVAVPHRAPLDVTVDPATGRAEHLFVFRRDVDLTHGTEAGSVTATGADGTKYTLAVPQDAAILHLDLTVTPLQGVDGLPGDPRVLGVQIEPSGTALLTGATLTIKPGEALSEKRALPATYDGDGSSVRLTPMTSEPGVFTFPLERTGGYLLIEGKASKVSSGRVHARAAGGLTLGGLFSYTPAPSVRAAQVSAMLQEEGMRQLLGLDDADDHDSMSALYDRIHELMVADLREAIASASADPTIGHWVHLLRYVLGMNRQFMLTGSDDGSILTPEVRDVLPEIRAVYQKVLAGLHSCDDGMADVLGLALTRLDSIAVELFDLPDDPSDACSGYQVQVHFNGTVQNPDFEGQGSYSTDVAWATQSLLTGTDNVGQASYQGSYEDACAATTGPVTPNAPWTLYGQNVDYDALLQAPDDVGTTTTTRAGFALMVDMGSGVQQMTTKDPDCGEADPFPWGPGPDRHMSEPDTLELVGGELHLGWARETESYEATVTAVP